MLFRPVLPLLRAKHCHFLLPPSCSWCHHSLLSQLPHFPSLLIPLHPLTLFHLHLASPPSLPRHGGSRRRSWAAQVSGEQLTLDSSEFKPTCLGFLGGWFLGSDCAGCFIGRLWPWRWASTVRAARRRSRRCCTASKVRVIQFLRAFKQSFLWIRLGRLEKRGEVWTSLLLRFLLCIWRSLCLCFWDHDCWVMCVHES